MSQTLTSFMIQCDIQGKILHRFWYEPAYLFSPYQTNIKDLFIVEEHLTVDTMICSALNEPERLFWEGAFKLHASASEISVYILATKQTVLVYGSDFSCLNDASTLDAVVGNFMRIVESPKLGSSMENSQTVRTQFEQIQKLNNELLNTQRQLKKANAQLNRLNIDLNNRLVKDPLTGLVSRYQYRTEIDLITGSQPDKKGIFTFIDIDDFKHINDTYGHQVGDDYLKTFAYRLTKVSLQNTICMRISGDEFGLFIHGYEHVGEEEVAKVWVSIQSNVLDRPISIRELDLNIGCSAGMAVYGQDTFDIYELIEYADFAMYQAKKHGKNDHRIFDLKHYLERNR